MKLREDSDPYCLLWVGVLVLVAYLFNFLLTYDSATIITLSLPILGLPLLLTLTLIGYLKPEKGKAKPNMLALSVVFAIFYLIITVAMYDLFNDWSFEGFIEALGFSSWGIGSAILTAGGLSILQPHEQSIQGGLLDLDTLHYPPGKIPEPEPEAESEPEAEPKADSEVESEEEQPETDETNTEVTEVKDESSTSE